MRGLNHGRLGNDIEVHDDAQYEDVYENVRNDVRVRNVINLNDLHAINGLGTNDDLMDDIVR